MDASARLFGIPLVIGVTGHRDLLPGEVPAIRAAVLRLLRSLMEAGQGARPTILSSMADGADLLVADVAADLGLSILAALALPPETTRAELGSDVARATFDRVYARSEPLEIPTPAGALDDAARDRQFRLTGGIVARHSTLLLAIWDGESTQHEAGTARTVEQRGNAIRYEIRCSRQSAREAGTGDGVKVLGFIGAGVRDSGSIPDELRAILSRSRS